MAKKMKSSRVVLLVILVVIIAVVAYQKYGVEPAAEEEEEAAEQEAVEQETTRAAARPAEKEAQPLYPDLCYAEGGKPVSASKGCAAGEENIGDVPGFRTPYICCVKQ